jgi:negative regulator of flagellin synthesis FlgM
LENTMKIGNHAEHTVGLAQATGQAASAESAKAAAAGASPAAGPDASAKVELSSTAATLLSGGSSPEFDADKVARISASIADGTFKVNADVIADKLIGNASELLGKVQH